MNGTTVKVLTHEDVLQAAHRVAQRIRIWFDRAAAYNEVRLYGVPRGGVPAAYMVAHALSDLKVRLLDTADNADWIIDDIIASGATRLRYPGKEFAALFTSTGEWLQFPWECGADGSDQSATDIPLRLLQRVGEDVTREGLRETPARFLCAWEHYTSGYKQDPKQLLKTFEDGAGKVDEMVTQRDIPVYSTCEHHLAPFWGVAHIAYIPNGKVLGLSKFVRLVEVFARRLQVQERLTQQIAHALNDNLEPQGVGVVLQCRHMCMEARGVRTQGSSTTTSCLLGAMKEDARARQEFLQWVK